MNRITVEKHIVFFPKEVYKLIPSASVASCASPWLKEPCPRKEMHPNGIVSVQPNSSTACLKS